MHRLTSMTQTEYNAFLERLVPEYAADKVRIGDFGESEALENAQKSIQRLLPQGLHTPHQYLYMLRDGDRSVGSVWLGMDSNCPTEMFVFDLYINESQRRKGYGTSAMRLIEEKAQELGFETIGLHVFGFNGIARQLYEKMGYTTTHVRMKKEVVVP